ncbi:LTA synthase family protein [Lentilactobacillus laojiaonis]|uniref:LTA synthase family protein n=1 Tax=Lentilactobacillus laojiaonis TaxID=2883998 RepID=UPI003D314ED1
MKNILPNPNTRLGIFGLLIAIFWLKTMFAYIVDFHLSVSNPFQFLIVLINPIATTLLLFGIALYCKKSRFFYPVIFLMDILNTVLLYLNVIYFREFTDFMTVSTMTGYSKVNQGLSGSSLALTLPHDVLYWIDLIIILILLFTRKIKIDHRPLNKRIGYAFSSLAVLFFTINLSLAEMDRPQLLTRTFDRTYIVKYLGIDAFTVYDGLKSQHNNDLRASATKSELNEILKFTKSHYAKPNSKYYGIAKNKNVIYIHLESFQQFLINQKINGQEVTPFLNSLYNSKSSYSFKNFFHQVGQGKTSDAENMLETSTYGLPQGSLFAQLGSDNTFQAAPAILKQEAGYSSGVFHGNIASFWNRNNVYKNLGYQYFFDASYYNTTGDRSLGYGLKDKLLFKDSVKYLEHLQQPFYAKYLTVTNHFPYDIDSEDVTNFTTTNTGDKVVDNYFLTAHYLDQSIKEFYDYLEKSGTLKNSVIVLYGDHYGISNSENEGLAKALGKNPETWTDFDSTQMQRVPFIINIPGQTNGKVMDEYAGEIDVLPTLMHLLGIDSQKYIQFGTDVFSPDHDQVVAFRNKDWVSPKYTSIDGEIYDSKTGKDLGFTDDAKAVKADTERVSKELNLSDSLNEKNLLRFYHPAGFKDVDPRKYNYSDELQKEKNIEKLLGTKSTSIFSKNHDQTTSKIYQTDAPEDSHQTTSSNRIKITNPDDNTN